MSCLSCIGNADVFVPLNVIDNDYKLETLTSSHSLGNPLICAYGVNTRLSLIACYNGVFGRYRITQFYWHQGKHTLTEYPPIILPEEHVAEEILSMVWCSVIPEQPSLFVGFKSGRFSIYLGTSLCFSSNILHDTTPSTTSVVRTYQEQTQSACKTILRKIRVLNPILGSLPLDNSTNSWKSSYNINDSLVYLIYEFYPNNCCPICWSLIDIFGGQRKNKQRTNGYSVLVQVLTKNIRHVLKGELTPKTVLERQILKFADGADRLINDVSIVPLVTSSTLLGVKSPILNPSLYHQSCQRPGHSSNNKVSRYLATALGFSDITTKPTVTRTFDFERRRLKEVTCFIEQTLLKKTCNNNALAPTSSVLRSMSPKKVRQRRNFGSGMSSLKSIVAPNNVSYGSVIPSIDSFSYFQISFMVVGYKPWLSTHSLNLKVSAPSYAVNDELSCEIIGLESDIVSRKDQKMQDQIAATEKQPMIRRSLFPMLLNTSVQAGVSVATTALSVVAPFSFSRLKLHRRLQNTADNDQEETNPQISESETSVLSEDQDRSINSMAIPSVEAPFLSSSAESEDIERERCHGIFQPHGGQRSRRLNQLKETCVSHVPELVLRLDLGRVGFTVVSCPFSPQWNLVTDSLGRIMLINGSTLRPIHMWRGYRDAEVAWVRHSTNSETKILSNPKNRCQINESQQIGIIIYAPRRGILEVWDLNQLNRIAAAQVGVNGTLTQLSPHVALFVGSNGRFLEVIVKRT